MNCFGDPFSGYAFAKDDKSYEGCFLYYLSLSWGLDGYELFF